MAHLHNGRMSAGATNVSDWRYNVTDELLCACGEPKAAHSKRCTTCANVGTRIKQARTQCGYTMPSFEITIYSTEGSAGAGRKTTSMLRRSMVEYNPQDLREDRVAMLYAIEHAGHVPRCFVTISNPGDLLDSWEGYQPEKIQQWITAALQETHDLAA